jgi:hypothetical protein
VKTYTYDVISTSKIHAADTDDKGGSGRDVHDKVTSGVSGGGEAPFQVLLHNVPRQNVPAQKRPNYKRSHYIRSHL